MTTASDEELKRRWDLDVMSPAEREPEKYDGGEAYHWESMAYGFFLAKGTDPERAQRLANEVRT